MNTQERRLYPFPPFAIAPLLLFVAYWCVGCANAVAPTGGEPDKTTPKIIATEPVQRATNVHPRYIALEFSKFVQQRSQVQQNLFLTPPIKVEYVWSGKTVFVNFKEPLDSNTTVALTLGTQYTDWDGNKPEAAYTLIFSTGSKLDSGTIRARVEADKPDGITAFLYQLTTNPDTLNPSTTKPKYKTQVGSNKTLEFPALAKGAYRLFVLRDEYRNDLIDKGTDAFGAATHDLVLPEGGTAEALLRIAPTEDLTPPRVFDVRQLSATRLAVKFSEKIHPVSLRLSNFLLRDSAGSLPLQELPRVQALHTDANNPAIVYCYTDKALQAVQTASSRRVERWQIVASAVRDSAGNTIVDSAKTAYFTVAQGTLPDTLLPALVRTQVLSRTALSPFIAPLLADSSRNVPQKPRIAFVFSSAVALGATTASVREIVWESVDGKTVPHSTVLEQANTLVVEPSTSLAPNTWYTVGFRTQAFQAWHGAALRDSVVVLRFQTEDARDYGGVSGMVRDSVFTVSTTAFVGVSGASISKMNISQVNISQATTAQASASTQASMSVVPKARILSTQAEYIVVLEATSSLPTSPTGASDSNAQQSQNAANSPAVTQVPTAATPQISLPFAEKRFEVHLKKPGAWEFANIPPGAYRLTAFVDANGNGRYDYGSAFPFVPAERFVVLQTDIQVRPRWTIENVMVVVP
jgi:hypothetical protein